MYPTPPIGRVEDGVDGWPACLIPRTCAHVGGRLFLVRVFFRSRFPPETREMAIPSPIICYCRHWGLFGERDLI
jgi:hypothetical protein